MNKESEISILDFGSQYTHLIARRIRQLGVLSKIYPPETTAKKLKNVQAIILSGGPNSVYDEKIKFDNKILTSKIPILGICYGLQLISYLLQGKVERGYVREYGLAPIHIKRKNELLKGWRKKEIVWMSHGDLVVKPPKGFSVLADTKDCPIAVIANKERKIYGVQFHPEVTQTKKGLILLKNFVYNIARVQATWNLKQYLIQIEKEVSEKVGSRKVFLLVSGGVDSTVCFSLLNRILGPNRVFGLHIDSGFMRQNESELIKEKFKKLGFTNLKVIKAGPIFRKRLKDIVHPEIKRKIIGKTYLDVKRQAMKKYQLNPKDWLLAQGTIYPDTIESGGTKHADKIKTHHNRVKEIFKLIEKGLLIEPLKELYKDEVRLLGNKIGVPKEIIDRHPFPGPGLAIRIICSRGKTDYKKINRLDKSLDDFLSRFNATWNLFLKGKVLPFKSVGVQGDERTYAYPAAISGEIPNKVLDTLSPAVGNEIKNVNRVLRMVYSKTPSLENGKLIKLLLTKSTTNLLKEIDALVNLEIKKAHLEQKIWQFPVVLAPFSLTGGLSVILRPVQSTEAMTVSFFKLPESVLKNIVNKLKRFPQVDLILYDITNKPPGTIEWE